MKENIGLRSIGASDRHGTGTAVIVRWSAMERFLRAGRVLLICWLSAAVCVLIPGLHFVLVPTLFFGGMIGAFVTYRKLEILESGSITCPKCDLVRELRSFGTRWPERVTCTGCGSVYYLQDASIPDLISISESPQP